MPVLLAAIVRPMSRIMRTVAASLLMMISPSCAPTLAALRPDPKRALANDPLQCVEQQLPPRARIDPLS